MTVKRKSSHCGTEKEIKNKLKTNKKCECYVTSGIAQPSQNTLIESPHSVHAVKSSLQLFSPTVYSQRKWDIGTVTVNVTAAVTEDADINYQLTLSDNIGQVHNMYAGTLDAFIEHCQF